jgi:hypothetical protein
MNFPSLSRKPVPTARTSASEGVDVELVGMNIPEAVFCVEKVDDQKERERERELERWASQESLISRLC